MTDTGMVLWDLEDSFARTQQTVHVTIKDFSWTFPQHWMPLSSLPAEITARRSANSVAPSEATSMVRQMEAAGLPGGWTPLTWALRLQITLVLLTVSSEAMKHSCSPSQCYPFASSSPSPLLLLPFLSWTCQEPVHLTDFMDYNSPSSTPENSHPPTLMVYG